MRKTIAVIAAAAIFGFAVSANAATIDNFTDAGLSYDTSVNNPESLSQTSVSGTISGDRYTSAYKLPGFGSNDVSIGIYDGFGVATMNSDVDTTGIWTFQYLDFTPTDMTDSGTNNSFGVDFLAADWGSSMTYTVTDSDDDTGSKTLAIPEITYGLNEVVYFNFADFDNPNVDFDAITDIVITLNGEVYGDYMIDLLETSYNPPSLPAPAALPAGLALLGLMAMRRRR